jgi:hypothetical protein
VIQELCFDLHNIVEMITLAGGGKQDCGPSLNRWSELPIETAPINHRMAIFDQSAQKKTECRIRDLHAHGQLM